MSEPADKKKQESEPCYVIVGLLWHIVIPNPNFRRTVESDLSDDRQPDKGDL